MIGWTCSVQLCKDDNRWGYPTSSLVRSNFKFTRDGKPVCVRCWNILKQQVLTALEEANDGS